LICLGIDGGGSKTNFLLVDGDRQIARLQSGASNWLSIGADGAAEAIRDGASRLPDHAIDSVCGGFAGAGRDEGRLFYQQVLRNLFPHSRIRVESDAFIAYIGAIGLEPGVLLIAGTGSIAIARRADGGMMRVGGWGPHFGDEGSGFWIGREAVRIALRLQDTDDDSEFSARVASALALPSVRDVPAAWAAGRLGVPAIAALVPLVVALWPAQPAADILRNAAAHLKDIANTAAERVGIAGCPICASGSVAQQPVIQTLVGLPLATPRASAEYGAVLLARQEV
jgi:N-acetylglucosamine kinase-like BadF-type ATPase